MIKTNEKPTRYLLLQNTPELLKGAIMLAEPSEFNCNYKCISDENYFATEEAYEDGVYHVQSVVEDNDDWFVPLVLTHLMPKQLKTVSKELDVREEDLLA